MQTKKKIALIGAIANPNLGDEALLQANLQLINKIYGKYATVYIFTKMLLILRSMKTFLLQWILILFRYLFYIRLQ